MKYALVFLVLSLAALTACESSTSIQQPQQAHVLEINPDSLVGELYKTYFFRARVTNYPTGNLNFYWALNGMGHGGPEYGKYFEFEDTGKHTIHVKAFNNFNDSLIAQGEASVFISSPGSFNVQLSRHLLDTTLFSIANGTFTTPLQLTAKATPAYREIEYEWHVIGNGIDSILTGYDRNSLFFLFPRPGEYIVFVAARKGLMTFGSDSAIVRVHFPTVDASLLQQAKNVSMTLSIDSSNPIIREPHYKNPLAVGLSFTNDATHSSQWTTTGFSTTYYTETGAGTNNYNKADDRLAGEFSSDYKQLRVATASVNDTSHFIQYSRYDSTVVRRAARYGFTLTDLTLVAVTPTEIIYSSGGRPLQQFLSDLYFYFNYVDYYPCTDPTTILLHYKTTTYAIARGTVVFTR